MKVKFTSSIPGRWEHRLWNPVKELKDELKDLFVLITKTHVESGEGIERVSGHVASSPLVSIQWNPVKELKAHGNIYIIDPIISQQWNPVKELKESADNDD